MVHLVSGLGLSEFKVGGFGWLHGFQVNIATQNIDFSVKTLVQRVLVSEAKLWIPDRTGRYVQDLPKLILYTHTPNTVPALILGVTGLYRRFRSISDEIPVTLIPFGTLFEPTATREPLKKTKIETREREFDFQAVAYTCRSEPRGYT